MTGGVSTDGLDAMSLLYLEYMRSTERAPANTIKARVRTLRAVGNPGTATREEIELWWELRGNLAASTRGNDLANLRTFYKWAQIWEHRPPGDDPTLRIPTPKVAHGSPKWVSKPDLQTMLDTFPDDLRRAVCLGAYAGLRVGEAAALHWTDIDMEMNRARVYREKTKTWSTIAVSPLLIDQLLPATVGNVVTGDEPMSAAQLQRRVNRAIKAAGIDATFHMLRHRYGTIALQATGNLVAVAKQMGHASVVSTTIYAAAADEVADQIAAAVIQ